MSFGRARWRTEIERQEAASYGVRCRACYEYETACRCDTAAETTGEAPESEGRLFFAGDDPELNDALDEYLTRTPAHPFDGDEDRRAVITFKSE